MRNRAILKRCCNGHLSSRDKEIAHEKWCITGFSRGFGLALANAALTEGDMVIGTARDKAPDLPSRPRKLYVVTLDVADGDAAEEAIRQALRARDAVIEEMDRWEDATHRADFPQVEPAQAAEGGS